MLNSSSIFGRSPITIRWLVNNTCNLNCAHCSYASSHLVRKQNLSTEEVFCILEKLSKQLRIGSLQFLGGEPLLRLDYQQIIEWAVDHEIPVSIITNGTLIDQQFYRFIKKTPLAEITFSIDGIDERSYGEMRKPRLFKTLIENVQRTVKFKHPDTLLKVHYVLTKINMFPPKEIIAFFENIGIDALSFNTLEIKGNALANREKLFVPPLRIFNFLDALYKDLSSYHIQVLPPTYPVIVEYVRKKYGLDIPFPYLGCPAVTTEMLILPDGTYIPCAALFTRKETHESLKLQAYSLLKMDIEEILNEEPIKKIISLKKGISYEAYYPCNECKYLGNFCQPCFMEAFLGQKMTNPICSLAIKRLREIEDRE